MRRRDTSTIQLREFILNPDVRIPAQLRNWASMWKIPQPDVDAALKFRSDYAKNFTFEQTAALAQAFHREFEAGYAIGFMDKKEERGE